MPLLETLSLEAQRCVPWSVSASSLAVVPIGFACGLFAGWLAGRAFAPRLPEMPWTERARASFGVRVAVRSVGLYSTFLVCGLTYLFVFFVGDTARLALSIASCLACYLGVDLVRLSLERDLHRTAIPLRGWWALKAIWFLLAAPQLLVVIVAGLLMPQHFNRQASIIALIAFSLVVTIGTGSLWRILRGVGFIREASPPLLAAIDEAQKKTKITAQGAWILPTWGVPFCNAFALPVLRRIAFTSDALDTLSHDEVVAIASHELGHVAESRTVAWVRTLRGSAFLPLALARPLEASFGATGILAAIFAMLGVALLFQRMSRALETRADRIAHGGAEETSPTYARALEKVYQRNLVPAVMPGKRVHGDLYDRMTEAGAKPDYPRPNKPKVRARLMLAMLGAVVIAIALTVLGIAVGDVVNARVVEGLDVEADARLAARDDDGAVVLLLEALTLVHDEPRTWARYARAMAEVRQCRQANDAITHARRLPSATEHDAAAPPTRATLQTLLANADRAIARCASPVFQ